jgi:CheY-like chemotaxis protein
MYRSAGLVRPIEILLVEDNPADVRLIIEGLKSTQVEHHLHTTLDGVQAVNFIRRQSPYELAPRPDLVLLDLNLPRMSGHEVLANIKMDPRYRRIPVIVLTSSKDSRDVEKVYDLNANSYIQKPTDLGMFQMLQSVQSFWLNWAVLPVPAV